MNTSRLPAAERYFPAKLAALLSKPHSLLRKQRVVQLSIACCLLWSVVVLYPSRLSSTATTRVQLQLREARQLPGTIGSKHHQQQEQQQSSQQLKAQQQHEHRQSRPSAADVYPGGGPASFAVIGNSSNHKRTVSDASVMFGMIGRQVAGELPYVLANIGRLAAEFKAAHIMFVENDSTDDTRDVFNTWAAAFTASSPNSRTAKLLGFKPSATGHKNLQVLAQARNQYLEQLSQPEYAIVDYLIAVDTDMCFPWEFEHMVEVINGLLPALGEAWHVLYANGACGWYKDFFGSNKEEVPFHTAGAVPVYCDLFALRDSSGASHTMAHSMVMFMPDTFDFSAMQNNSAVTFECMYVNGQSVVPVQAAFGGWAMYNARMFQASHDQQDGEPEAEGCRHDEGDRAGCEHLSLSECLVSRFGVRQVIATGLVVNWEGCSERQQHRWDGWYPGRGPVEV